MRRAYFENGVIIESRQGRAAFNRIVRRERLDYDGHILKVWFKPCDQWAKAFKAYKQK